MLRCRLGAAGAVGEQGPGVQGWSTRLVYWCACVCTRLCAPGLAMGKALFVFPLLF